MRFGADDRLAYSIANAAVALDVSRSTIYGLMDSGRLATLKIGSRTIIPRTSLEALLDELVTEPRSRRGRPRDGEVRDAP